MTERIQQLTIILDEPLRSDYVKEIAASIKLIKGVGSVVLGEPTSISDQLAAETYRSKVGSALHKVIYLASSDSKGFSKVAKLAEELTNLSDG